MHSHVLFNVMENESLLIDAYFTLFLLCAELQTALSPLQNHLIPFGKDGQKSHGNDKGNLKVNVRKSEAGDWEGRG